MAGAGGAGAAREGVAREAVVGERVVGVGAGAGAGAAEGPGGAVAVAHLRRVDAVRRLLDVVGITEASTSKAAPSGGKGSKGIRVAPSLAAADAVIAAVFAEPGESEASFGFGLGPKDGHETPGGGGASGGGGGGGHGNLGSLRQLGCVAGGVLITSIRPTSILLPLIRASV